MDSLRGLYGEAEVLYCDTCDEPEGSCVCVEMAEDNADHEEDQPLA